MQKATDKVFKILQDNCIALIPHHIPGQHNALVDLASRVGQVIGSELTLAKQPFLWVTAQSVLGAPGVDLFASRLNAQTVRFVSSCPDPAALSVDSLSCA